MEPDSWTPGRGWAIGMGKAAYRTFIVAGLVGVIVYFAWPALGQVLPFYGLLLAVMAGSGAVGLPAGYLVARKLAEDSGLAGRSLVLPVLGLLVLAQIGAFRVAGALRGPGGALIFALQAGFIAWSVIACARTLILE